MGDGYQEVQEVISIHAPTRGATNEKIKKWQSEIISIHAPTRGATAQNVDQTKIRTISIHAPTRGATLFIQPFKKS